MFITLYIVYQTKEGFNILSTQIAELLKKERENQGLSPTELAKKAGVTQRAITYWETGKRSMTVDCADKVFKALGVTITIGKEDRQ